MQRIAALLLLVVLALFAFQAHAGPTLSVDTTATHCRLRVNGAMPKDIPAANGTCTFDAAILGTGAYELTVSSLQVAGAQRIEGAALPPYCVSARDVAQTRVWAHSWCLVCTPRNGSQGCISTDGD